MGGPRWRARRDARRQSAGRLERRGGGGAADAPGEPPRSGRFIAIASAAGHRGLQQLTAYGASKHAVVGLVRGLAADLRGTGITATAVSPGSTRTEMLRATAALYGLDTVEPLAERHLVERVLEPEEVADTVRWLCSPRSRAITGSVIHADGGFTA